MSFALLNCIVKIFCEDVNKISVCLFDKILFQPSFSSLKKNYLLKFF